MILAAVGIAVERDRERSRGGGVDGFAGDKRRGPSARQNRDEKSGAVKLSVGAGSACVVMSGGTIKCWGRNFGGELGAGIGGQTMNPSGVPPYSVEMGNETTNQTSPVDVLHITDAVDVSVGSGSACAILADGSVKFHKDGYTDLRGRFDYASVNTPERQAIQRFSVLILSEERGAVIREAAPPQQ